MLDGAAVKVEDRLATWGYHRLILSCVYHAGCTRSRNTNLNGSFGRLEPVAFLACWHKAGQRITKAEHRLFKPTLADQRDWLVERGHIPA